jgi:hypothetical protein
MHYLNRLPAYVSYPYHYLRIALRWRKSRKKGGALALRVRNFAAFAKELNENQVPYVLLRGFPSQGRLRANNSQEDFDVLVSATSIQNILTLGALVPGEVPVDIYFDLRPSVQGYHYFPPILAQQILAARTANADGYSIPDPLHHFLSLSYHVVYQKGMNDKLDRPLEETVLKSKHYETLKTLGSHSAVQFDGPYTLFALHEFLKSRKFNMPFDLLKKWPVQHPLLKLIYEAERRKLEAMSPHYFPLAFTVRTDAGAYDDDGVSEVSELISQELEISRVIKLSEEQIKDLSVGSRGGNWVERQRKQYYHVLPTHVIICDIQSRDLLDQFCENKLPVLKKTIRDKMNQRHPHPTRKQRYVIHGADDLWESLDCLRIIGAL